MAGLRRSSILLFGIAAMAGLAIASSVAKSSTVARRPWLPLARPTHLDVDAHLSTLLYRIGLQPESLAAAAVSASQTSGVVAAAREWTGKNAGVIEDVDHRLAARRTNFASLLRVIRSGLATADQTADLRTVGADVASLESEQLKELDVIFATATASLSKDQVATLARIRANRGTWDLPVQYLVVDRTSAEWVALRDALVSEKMSQLEGDDLDPACQSFLSTVRSTAEIAASKTLVDSTLSDISASWESAAVKQ